MSASSSRYRIGAAGVLAFVVAGCAFIHEDDGKPREAVSGTVTLDGQPLNGGSIVFIQADVDSTDVASAAIENGRFSIPRAVGPITGRHKIRISRVVTSPVNPNAAPGEPSKSARETLPEKYNNQTVLTAEIRHGPPNELVFHLESE